MQALAEANVGEDYTIKWSTGSAGSNGTVPDKRRCGYPHYTEVYRRIDHRNESGENRDQR